MKVDIILGLQWGDEGKGKIVDVLAPRYDVVARFQGGPNAGHTIEFNGKKFILHTIPSGIFYDKITNLIGNGVIIDPLILSKEVAALRQHGIEPADRMLVSRRAHLILPTHRVLDAYHEMLRGATRIGSTLKGIGPCYTDKISRNGLRVGDLAHPAFLEWYRRRRSAHLESINENQFRISELMIDGMGFLEYEEKWLEASQVLAKMQLVDSEYFLADSLVKGNRVLAEGAQGTMLDVDFGSYPYVTSSNTMAGGAVTGLGIPPSMVGEVIGVFKAYCTRVGSGPFPTEELAEIGEKIRSSGNEYGSTTGRPRRCGWLDLPALNYASMISGVTKLVMMKTDVLNDFDELQVCTAYKVDGKKTTRIPFDYNTADARPQYQSLKGWKQPLDKLSSGKMPVELLDYIAFIEKYTGLPIHAVSYGPDRDQIYTVES